jgi:hypothetical protein
MARPRLWLAVFLSGFAIIVVLSVWTFLTPVFTGDLARVGRLSEDEFRGRDPQPAIDHALLRASPLDQADVVVVGDSYSQGLLWQTELVRAGYRVATLPWNDVGTLCADFAPWLREYGFRGRLVIVESVERELDTRLASSLACPKMTRRPRVVSGPVDPSAPAKAATVAAPVPHRFGQDWNWDESLTTGLVTAIRTPRARNASGDLIVGDWGGDRVRVAPVSDGCERFSHRLCGKALFFADDLERPALTDASLDRMASIGQRSAPLLVTWMVVPNKSTVYLAPQRMQPVAQGLVERRLGPDLFDFATEQSRLVRDFYRPDDTHFSPRGFQVVGRRMAEEVRKLRPLAPP